jgi:hypothetical protein
MSGNHKPGEGKLHDQEIVAKSTGGMPVLLLNIVLMIAALLLFIFGIKLATELNVLGIIMIVAGSIYLFIIGPIIFLGLKVLKPNEALVLTLFRKILRHT